jgi:hypothetical protein
MKLLMFPKYILLKAIIVALLLLASHLNAQVIVPVDTIKQVRDASSLHQSKKHDVPQIDIADEFRKIFRLKNDIKDTIIKKPGKLYLSFLPGIGYAILTGLTAVATTNLSFYTSKGDSANISTIQGLVEYGQNKQLVNSVISSIWTKKNRINFLGDWRYYNYSSYTYGLGGESLSSDADLIYYDYLRINQLAVTQIIPDFLGGIGYNLDYHWHIKDGTPDAIPQNDYTKYGRTAVSTSSGVSLNLLYDTRRNSNNPQGGQFANVIYRPNFTFMGSDQNWQSLFLDYRKYIRLPANSNNVLAFWNFYWFTLNGTPPYFDLPSTGWDTYSNSGRQFIQGRYRSRNMLYFETEYRFVITRNGLLGALVFANAQSFSEWQTNQFETVSPGAGLGIRIKANKYSDTSLIITYGVGVRGARGFLFNLGEMF